MFINHILICKEAKQMHLPQLSTKNFYFTKPVNPPP